MDDKTLEKKDRVVVRFAGDSGDGMQLTGSRFTDATAMVGNDLATLPDFPAEIRAPAGTPHGVSAFQIHFASRDILTPGDHPNVLVAMNPAALITNLGAVEKGGTVIVNEDAFSDHNLRKAGYDANPLEDDTLDDYQVFRVPMTSMTVRATEEIDGHHLARRRALPRTCSRSAWCPGCTAGRPSRRPTGSRRSSRPSPPVRDANLAAFRAGYNFGETAELLAVHYEVKPAPAPPGTYRNVNGTPALAYGLVAASVSPACRCSTRATRSRRRRSCCTSCRATAGFGVRTMQAEDEIAAVNMALGAAFAGHLGVTATSGPGMDLKAETIGLAVAIELPLVVIDVQRAGPSTGMPTKTEAADLLLALYGRHGESPLPVVARLHAVGLLPRRHRGGAHRGQAPHAGDPALRHLPGELLRAVAAARRGARCPRSTPTSRPSRTTATRSCPTCATTSSRGPGRCPARPGLRHRIGGLEKEDGSGQHLLRAREPRPHDAPARRADRARRGPGPGGGRPGRRRRAAGARLGLELRRDPGRRAPRAPRAGRERGHRPHPPPQPAARATPARCCAPTSGCSCPR